MLSEPPGRFAIPGSLPGLVRIICLSVLSLIRDEEIGKFLLQRSDLGLIANHNVGIAGILESKILCAGSCRLFSPPDQGGNIEPAKAGSESDKKAVAAAIADPLKARLQKSLLVFIDRCASFQRRGTDQGPE